jgi:hypothetical protein
MIRQMKVVGTVTYIDDAGKRLSIPNGVCEIDDESENFTIRWKNRHGNACQSTLSNLEFAQYLHNKAILPL